MQVIQTIEQLIETLNDTDPSEQGSVLKRIDIPTADFDDFASWKKSGYTRNCIERTKDYELILLCWDQHSGSPVHGHGGQDCWVYQVKGTVCEKRFIKTEEGLVETNFMELKEGRMTYMHDRMGFHSIQNTSDSRAMTLHLYASPIDECRVFNVDKQKFEQVQLNYYSAPGITITA
ncbi:MAG: cysteine dioxygenase [Crocinitomicaceae bacterium]